MMSFFKKFSLRDFNERFRALRYVQDRSMSEVKSAREQYDSFVRVAEKNFDGYLIGYAKSSSRKEVAVRAAQDSIANTLIQGTPGCGKTRLGEKIYRQHVEAKTGVSIWDCKWDSYEGTLNWTAAHAETLPREEREELFRQTVPFNPFSSKAIVPLNICCPIPGVPAETQAFEITCALARLYENNLTFPMESLLRHVITLLIEYKPIQLSLIEAPLILRDETLRMELVHQSTNERTKEFFFRSYSDIVEQTKQAVRTRLELPAMCKTFHAMFGANKTLDLRKVISQNQNLLVFLGRHVSAPTELVMTFGSLIFQLFLQAGYSFGSRRNARYPVIIDEFHHIVDAPGMMSRLATALSTMRSFGIEFWLAHHDFSQVPTSLREALLSNVDRFALFRSAGDNADWFGEFLEVNPNDLTDPSAYPMSRADYRSYQRQVLQSLPNRHFLWYDRRQPYRALRLRAPDVPDAQQVFGLTDAELDRIRVEREWDTGSHAVPIETLEAQIVERHKRLSELLRPPITVTEPPPIRTTKSRKRPPQLG